MTRPVALLRRAACVSMACRKTCQKYNIVPVQQFISMMDRDVVSLKHRGVGAVGGRAIFECLRYNKHIHALDMVTILPSTGRPLPLSSVPACRRTTS